jgi:hypothetical protein
VDIRLSRNDLDIKFGSALALISDTKPYLLFRFGYNHIRIFFYYSLTLKIFRHPIFLLVRPRVQHSFLFISVLNIVIQFSVHI